MKNAFFNRWNSASITKKAETCSKPAFFLCQLDEKCLLTKEQCLKLDPRPDSSAYCMSQSVSTILKL